MLNRVDWFSGVSHLRPKLHRAVSAGLSHDELPEAEIADVFREYARRVDPRRDTPEWDPRSVDRDGPHPHLDYYIHNALLEEIYSHRTNRGHAASDLYLLADDLDPDLSLEDVRRRQWVRSSNRHRAQGDTAEAERLLDCMRREIGEAE